jgi:hypothetical protein
VKGEDGRAEVPPLPAEPNERRDEPAEVERKEGEPKQGHTRNHEETHVGERRTEQRLRDDSRCFRMHPVVRASGHEPEGGQDARERRSRPQLPQAEMLSTGHKESQDEAHPGHKSHVMNEKPDPEAQPKRGVEPRPIRSPKK